MAYILHEERRLGRPSMDYMDILMKGYAHWGFGTDTLEEALADSIGYGEAEKYMEEFRKERMSNG